MTTGIPQETMQKVTGNVSEELTETGYRMAADALVHAIAQRINKTPIPAGALNNAEKFLGTKEGEPFLSFLLAVALEVLPMDSVEAQRRFLASNLRIRAYQALGQSILKFSGLIDGEVKSALATKDFGNIVADHEEKMRPKTAA